MSMLSLVQVKLRSWWQLKLRTFNPAAAAGPLGSTVCMYTGLEPRTTKPNPTASLFTYNHTHGTVIGISFDKIRHKSSSMFCSSRDERWQWKSPCCPCKGANGLSQVSPIHLWMSHDLTHPLTHLVNDVNRLHYNNAGQVLVVWSSDLVSLMSSWS